MNDLNEMVKRTTVSLEDEYYAILERWADKEVRSVGNLIQAIVVTYMRGGHPEPPQEIEKLLKALQENSEK